MKAKWKYIVYRDAQDAETIATFAPAIVHAAYAASIGVARHRIVSAGFVTAEGECYGMSTSLGVPSRPRTDTVLLREDDCA